MYAVSHRLNLILALAVLRAAGKAQGGVGGVGSKQSNNLGARQQRFKVQEQGVEGVRGHRKEGTVVVSLTAGTTKVDEVDDGADTQLGRSGTT